MGISLNTPIDSNKLSLSTNFNDFKNIKSTIVDGQILNGKKERKITVEKRSYYVIPDAGLEATKVMT